MNNDSNNNAFGIGALGSLVGLITDYFFPYEGYKFQETPLKYKDDILLSGKEESALRNNLYGAVGRDLSVTRNRINQVGAANKLPSGAILSSLANAAGTSARAISNVPLKINKMKRQYLLQYLAGMQPYELFKGQEHYLSKMNQRANLQEGFGALTSATILKEAGLL